MYTGTLDSLPHENDPAVNVDELWRRTYRLAQEYVVENEPAAVLERIHTAHSALQKTALLAAMLQSGVLAEQDETWRPHRGQVVAAIAQLLRELDLLVVFGNRPVLTAFYALLEGYTKTAPEAGTVLVEVVRRVGDTASLNATFYYLHHITLEHLYSRRCYREIARSTQTVPDSVQAAGVQNTAGHPEPRRSVHSQPGACRAEKGRQSAEIRRLCESRVLPADPELPDLPADEFFPDGGQTRQGDARAGAGGVPRPRDTDADADLATESRAVQNGRPGHRADDRRARGRGSASAAARVRRGRRDGSCAAHGPSAAARHDSAGCGDQVARHGHRQDETERTAKRGTGAVQTAQPVRLVELAVRAAPFRGVVLADDVFLALVLRKRKPALLAHAVHLSDLADGFLERGEPRLVVLDLVLLDFLHLVVELRVPCALVVFPQQIAEQTQHRHDYDSHPIDERAEDLWHNAPVLLGDADVGRDAGVHGQNHKQERERAGNGHQRELGPLRRNKGRFAQSGHQTRGVDRNAEPPVVHRGAVGELVAVLEDVDERDVDDGTVVEAVDGPRPENLHVEEVARLADFV
ncbi:hypothetical protein KL942_004443 [Ogataea angusta]|uniref:Uncharacterized protein n=1 Tax=Pichia angusta TaxID=870730 RepID=A0ABQ7RUG4_PICAN|nr:hypothetical protein KL942_004443 [Ogataea angusta]KAG7847664.1 hypothetical protein KL940_003576 [Ogataea angusta]